LQRLFRRAREPRELRKKQIKIIIQKVGGFMNNTERLSISLPIPLVRFLEQYQTNHTIKSRSEVLERAVKLLQEQSLIEEYRQSALENDPIWNSTINDGLNEPY
jgi:antitoxin ParD1/3/4